MHKLFSYLLIVLLVVGIYVVSDIYFSGLKVNKPVRSIYRNVLVARYIDKFKDYALENTILNLSNDFRSLPLEDKFSYYREVIICCEVLVSSAEAAETFSEVLADDQENFDLYLQEFIKTDAYNKLASDKRRRINAWVSTISK